MIDLPLSIAGFEKYFLANIPKLTWYLHSNKFPVQLSVSDLTPVFSSNWHIFRNQNTSTTQRIFWNDIDSFQGKNNDNMSRYWK